MRMVKRVCPVCETAAPAVVTWPANFDLGKLDAQGFASRKLPENMHLELHTCQRCDVMYANPAIDSTDLVQAYTEASYESSQEADDASRTYQTYLAHHLSRLMNKKAALDVGCGNGSFLQRLQELGFQEQMGVEPSTAPIQAASPNVRSQIIHGAYGQELFPEQRFDLVSCFMTLEHVSAPAELIRDFHRILRPAGLVYCVTHNYRSWPACILGTKSPIYDVEHMQLFSPQSLETLLRNTGFSDIQVFPIRNEYPLSYWIKLLPLPKGPKLYFIALLKRLGLGDMKISLSVGNIAVIGQKP